MRQITPNDDRSRYVVALAHGLCSIGLRVDDLDGALETSVRVGVPTVQREEGLADTDPAATFGLPIEWTT